MGRAAGQGMALPFSDHAEVCQYLDGLAGRTAAIQYRQKYHTSSVDGMRVQVMTKA